MPSDTPKRQGRPPKPESERTGNFSVRMPQDLRAKLEEAAQGAGRSTNAEIVYRLQGSIEGVEGSPKRQAIIDALIEAAEEAVRWWEAVGDAPEAEEYRDLLKDSMDDLDTWLTRLTRLDSAR